MSFKITKAEGSSNLFSKSRERKHGGELLFSGHDADRICWEIERMPFSHNKGKSCKMLCEFGPLAKKYIFSLIVLIQQIISSQEETVLLIGGRGRGEEFMAVLWKWKVVLLTLCCIDCIEVVYYFVQWREPSRLLIWDGFSPSSFWSCGCRNWSDEGVWPPSALWKLPVRCIGFGD